MRQLERGEVSALDAIDILLAEELTVRESRRIKTALVMARLAAVKTLAGFDFSFQPSLDRDRILALAQLEFIDRKAIRSSPRHCSIGFSITSSSSRSRDRAIDSASTQTSSQGTSAAECRSPHQRRSRHDAAAGRGKQEPQHPG